MRTIRFSHTYGKMPADFGVSKLLEVLVADSGHLHEGFVEYDTSFGEGGENYPLPRGKLMILLLQTRDDKVLWTTIRRCTPSKLKYYSGLRGSFVKCEVIDIKEGY